MTLDEFRAEAAGWIGRPIDAFACSAWIHEPGRRPQKCALPEADALSVLRAEYEEHDDNAASLAAAVGTPEAVASGAAGDEPRGEPCTLHEVKVVYLLAQKLLGFRGAVQPSASGRSWNLYRDE